MKKIEIVEFKQRCLELLDQLDGDGLIVARNGVPVARVMPLGRTDTNPIGNNTDLIGSLRGKMKIKGDVCSTGSQWDANGKS
jgi:antitoxin (DNA-binding transcriptional repressor) of toxin-antitoxin stability system